MLAAAVQFGVIDGSGAVSGPLKLADGTSAAPSLAFASEATLGFYRAGAGNLGLVTSTGHVSIDFAEDIFVFTSSTRFGWTNSTTNAFSGALDTQLTREALGVIGLKGGSGGTGDSVLRGFGANGGYWERGAISELLVLSTVGATTDTVANLLPANAIIEAVTARVIVTITTATDWKLGDATTAGRFTAALSGASLTAGATTVGLVHVDQTGAAGPRQTAASKLRVTTTGTPGAGSIRITTYYRAFVPATS